MARSVAVVKPDRLIRLLSDDAVRAVLARPEAEEGVHVEPVRPAPKWEAGGWYWPVNRRAEGGLAPNYVHTDEDALIRFLETYNPYPIGSTLGVQEPWSILSKDGKRELTGITPARVPPGFRLAFRSERKASYARTSAHSPWRPSTTLPKDLVRLILRVTSSAETIRLEDVGVQTTQLVGFEWRGNPSDRDNCIRPTFFASWQDRYRKTPFTSRDNPWVRIIRFRRIRPVGIIQPEE